MKAFKWRPVCWRYGETRWLRRLRSRMRKPPLICVTLISHCYHLLVSHMPVPKPEACFLKHNRSVSKGSAWEEEASLMMCKCSELLWRQNTWERLRKFTLDNVCTSVHTADPVYCPCTLSSIQCPPVPHRDILMSCGGVLSHFPHERWMIWAHAGSIHLDQIIAL